MNKLKKFKLVEGEFNPTDSNSILNALFSSKINFHQLESFRIQEKNSGNVDYHHHRIEELKSAYSEIKNIIDTASSNGYNLKIQSNVELSFVKK
ncbi:MAG: hypothetical protein JNM51_09475 [Bacteroidia bacterium]|nr:hypothetical protein [Bacteroidia bacterium]